MKGSSTAAPSGSTTCAWPAEDIISNDPRSTAKGGSSSSSAATSAPPPPAPAAAAKRQRHWEYPLSKHEKARMINTAYQNEIHLANEEKKMDETVIHTLRTMNERLELELEHEKKNPRRHFRLSLGGLDDEAETNNPDLESAYDQLGTWKGVAKEAIKKASERDLLELAGIMKEGDVSPGDSTSCTGEYIFLEKDGSCSSKKIVVRDDAIVIPKSMALYLCLGVAAALSAAVVGLFLLLRTPPAPNPASPQQGNSDHVEPMIKKQIPAPGSQHEREHVNANVPRAPRLIVEAGGGAGVRAEDHVPQGGEEISRGTSKWVQPKQEQPMDGADYQHVVSNAAARANQIQVQSRNPKNKNFAQHWEQGHRATFFKNTDGGGGSSSAGTSGRGSEREQGLANDGTNAPHGDDVGVAEEEVVQYEFRGTIQQELDRALTYYSKGECNESADRLFHLLRSNLTDQIWRPRVLRNYGYTLFCSTPTRKPEAVEAFQHAFHLDEQQHPRWAWNLLGYIFASYGDNQQALFAFDNGLNIDAAGQSSKPEAEQMNNQNNKDQGSLMLMNNFIGASVLRARDLSPAPESTKILEKAVKVINELALLTDPEDAMWKATLEGFEKLILQGEFYDPQLAVFYDWEQY
eukprot:g12432.t1